MENTNEKKEFGDAGRNEATNTDITANPSNSLSAENADDENSIFAADIKKRVVSSDNSGIEAKVEQNPENRSSSDNQGSSDDLVTNTGDDINSPKGDADAASG